MAVGPTPPQSPPGGAPPGGVPGAGIPDTPTAPQVLAELELVRRKAELLEKRMVTLESALVAAQKALRQLEAVAPNASPAEVALNELQHRIGRLERRRAAEVRRPTAPGAPVAAAAAPEAPRISGIESPEAKAIVNAEWSTAIASPGEDVRLGALLDGFDEGVRVQVIIRSIAAETPLAQMEVPTRDTRLAATWQVPVSQGGTELFFEVSGGGQRARSGTLVVLAAGQ